MKYTLKGFIEELMNYNPERLGNVYILGGGQYNEEDYRYYENTLIKAIRFNFMTGTITIEIF